MRGAGAVVEVGVGVAVVVAVVVEVEVEVEVAVAVDAAANPSVVGLAMCGALTVSAPLTAVPSPHPSASTTRPASSGARICLMES